MLSGRAAREYSGAHFKFQRKPERQPQWSKDSKTKIANWPSKFQADSYNSHLFWFQFWLFILFNFAPQLSSDKLKLFDCSLSQISLIIIFFFFFLFCPFFSSIFQTINIFLQAQSFGVKFSRPVRFKVKYAKEQAKFKEQKAKSKCRKLVLCYPRALRMPLYKECKK